MTTGEGQLPRRIRQAEIIPQQELARVAAVVVGCGAIGSWLTRFLAHMGVPFFLLIDHDRVENENLSLQGYPERYLGMAKVDALREVIAEIDDSIKVRTGNYGRRIDDGACAFRGDHLELVPAAYDLIAVFSCLDSIEVRRSVYGSVRGRCGLFVDGRMASWVWRVITVDRWPDYYYEETLFAPHEANVLRCTARGTVSTAAAPAQQMAVQLMRWLRGGRTAEETLDRDVEGNLLATTLVTHDVVRERRKP